MPGDKVPEFDPPRKPADFPPRPFVDDRGLEWRDVVGYEGRYLISETGDVFSLLRGGKGLSQIFVASGYRVSLCDERGVRQVLVGPMSDAAFGKRPKWTGESFGAHCKGDAHHCATVDSASVNAVRQSVCDGKESVAEAARRTGIPHQTIRHWIAGENRNGCGGPTLQPFDLVRRRRKMTDAEVVAARESRRRGDTLPAIAARYGVTKGQIWKLVVGMVRQQAGGPIMGIDYDPPAKTQPEPTPEPEQFEAKRKLMYDEHGELAFIQIDFDAEDDDE